MVLVLLLDLAQAPALVEGIGGGGCVCGGGGSGFSSSTMRSTFNSDHWPHRLGSCSHTTGARHDFLEASTYLSHPWLTTEVGLCKNRHVNVRSFYFSSASDYV